MTTPGNKGGPVVYPNSRIGKSHFIVYSNGVEPFATNAENYCKSALAAGFDTATHYTETMLREPPFWAQNSAILEQPRGAGYWLWKPYIILEKLRQVEQDDIVIYNDAGRYKAGAFHPFPSFPHAAAELTAMMPKRFILGSRLTWLVQGQYTKRDCFILGDADTKEMRLAPQINACPALFMPSADAFEFLETWLELARDPRMLTDQPDELGQPYPEFADHRHDQAIASILLHKMKGHYFDLSEDGAFREAEDIRQRNRRVPRLPTHIGYLSLIAARALEDDFFANPDLRAPSLRRLIRNIDPDEPIPQHAEVTPPSVLVSDFMALCSERPADMTPDHLRALVARNRITARKLHALGKIDADPAPLLKDAVKQTVSQIEDGGPVDTIDDATRLSVRALHAMIAARPEVETEVMAQLAWSLFDDDGRAIFKARFKRHNSVRGRAALTDFGKTLIANVILPVEAEVADRDGDLQARILKELSAWLPNYVPDPQPVSPADQDKVSVTD